MGYSMQKCGAIVDNQPTADESAAPASRPQSKTAALTVGGCNGRKAG
jgi:hypothetical protein